MSRRNGRDTVLGGDIAEARGIGDDGHSPPGVQQPAAFQQVAERAAGMEDEQGHRAIVMRRKDGGAGEPGGRFHLGADGSAPVRVRNMEQPDAVTGPGESRRLGHGPEACGGIGGKIPCDDHIVVRGRGTGSGWGGVARHRSYARVDWILGEVSRRALVEAGAAATGVHA